MRKKFNTTRREVGSNKKEVRIVQQSKVGKLNSLPSPEANQNNSQVAGLRICNDIAKEMTERVVFLTIEAIVENPSSKYKTGAYIFFDSGSQLTFISERLMQKLKLTPSSKEILTLYTFAAKKPLKKSAQLVEFYLLLKNDDKKLIQAYVISRVSEELQRINEKGESETVLLDLLIGSAYYWDVVKETSEERDAEGCFKITTTLGDAYFEKREASPSKLMFSSALSCHRNVANRPAPVNAEEFRSLETIRN